MMNVIIKTGNIINDDAEVLTNTVNCQGVMGKGIALEFKHAYYDMFKSYKRQCAKGLITPGKMSVYVLDEQPQRYIINFPTKRYWRNPSKIEYISEGLDHLYVLLKELKIKTIAMPPLGCGNGGLDWTIVKPLIFHKLERLNITLHLYEPTIN